MENKKSSAIPEPLRTARKPRADGRRNRELIRQAAKAAFTDNGAGTSLDDIAKQAGVGAGTLYRHFPSRELLLAAVYCAEVETLAEAAEEFERTLPPVEALRAWLLLFVDHLAMKLVIAAALNSLVGARKLFADSKPRVYGAVASLFERTVASGDIRPDIDPIDILRALVGVTHFGTAEDWQQTATRLVDILIHGSRPFSEP